MRRRGIDHQLETLLGRWKLWNVVVWVCSANMFLHRTIALFLEDTTVGQQSSAQASPFGRGVHREARKVDTYT